MSSPDARLSAAERAALADLEAAAAAHDPALASRLRGSTAVRAKPLLIAVKRQTRRAWTLLLGLRWSWAPLTVLGLFLIALGLSSGLAFSLVGIVVAAAGLRVLAEIVDERFVHGGRPTEPRD